MLLGLFIRCFTTFPDKAIALTESLFFLRNSIILGAWGALGDAPGGPWGRLEGLMGAPGRSLADPDGSGSALGTPCWPHVAPAREI